MAIGALEAAEEMGYHVPEDVAIIGFDDIPEAQWVRPRLLRLLSIPPKWGGYSPMHCLSELAAGATVHGSRSGYHAGLSSANRRDPHRFECCAIFLEGIRKPVLTFPNAVSKVWQNIL